MFFYDITNQLYVPIILGKTKEKNIPHYILRVLKWYIANYLTGKFPGYWSYSAHAKALSGPRLLYLSFSVKNMSLENHLSS